jgi:aminopeptidase-like protein
MLEKTELQHYLEILFPINRSLTGKGNIQTLEILKSIVPELRIKYAKSGTKVYDWRIPMEWEVESAYLSDLNGNVILDYFDSNLNLVQYSESFCGEVAREELMSHLHISEINSDAIPYVTAYYNQYWGFCLSRNLLETLNDDKYYVHISTRKFQGKMHYGEIYIPGKTQEEIVMSTYICHPSMANNELSGPLVSVALADELKKLGKELRYSYRFLFLPETIGSLYYIKKNYRRLKKKVKAIFVLTCIGDNRNWSFLKSRYGDTLADKVTAFAFKQYISKFTEYDYLSRGSDERQFGSPGVNLPVVSIMRSKYGTYDEYHSSKDNLELVNGANLRESADFICSLIGILERNVRPRVIIKGEPFYSRRRLREQTFNNRALSLNDANISNFLAYCDGNNDLIDICNIIQIGFEEACAIFDLLRREKIVKDIS